MSHFNDVAAFPLCWPTSWPRTRNREKSRFTPSTLYSEIAPLQEELRKLGVAEVIISTSVPLRVDGLPLSKPPVDRDPGAAVYFVRKGKPLCLACDKFHTVPENLHAITLTIEAIRGIERWGSSDLLDRAFTGFSALPAPHAVRTWWHVLGVDQKATWGDIELAHRKLALANHPDVGGSHDKMAEINAAMESAKAERKNLVSGE